MGHIVYADPGIATFHLLDRLRRDLVRRGHIVTVLCLDRTSHTFWRHQTNGIERPGGSWSQPYDRAADWLAKERPDLVLFHERRSAERMALATEARRLGCRVLWTGQGLLPHTVQLDDHGLDADASIRRRSPAEFRVVDPDRALLEASLVHAMSNAHPVGLPRRIVKVPPVRERLLDALACLRAGRVRAAADALHGWTRALPNSHAPTRSEPLPGPNVCVLLQDHDDARVLLDAEHAPTAAALLRRVETAAHATLPGTAIVAVLPAHAKASTWRPLRRQFAGRVQFAAASDATAVAVAAAAVVTVNAPTATTALLAGTPVVHLGDALFALPGVTVRTALDDLEAALATALRVDRPALRRRFLTWLLQHAHVWCSCSAPSHNGMLGLVQAVERRLHGEPGDAGKPLPYRPGPAWPLTIP